MQNCERIVYIFVSTVWVVKQVLANGRDMYRVILEERLKLPSFGKNVLTNSGFKSLIGSSYVFSFTLTFNLYTIELL